MNASQSVGELIEATADQKREYLSKVSHGFTRGLYADIPPEDLPLFANGHDFYILTLVRPDVVTPTI